LKYTLHTIQQYQKIDQIARTSTTCTCPCSKQLILFMTYSWFVPLCIRDLYRTNQEKKSNLYFFQLKKIHTFNDSFY